MSGDAYLKLLQRTTDPLTKQAIGNSVEGPGE